MEERTAVYVSTVNSRHAADTLAAARAGRHVLCDKPLASTAADARAMVAGCAAAGVLLGVNHNLRCAPVHRAPRQPGRGRSRHRPPRAVAGRGALVASGEDGLRAVEVALAARDATPIHPTAGLADVRYLGRPA
jgi:GFO/IDH/MocA oxidoreductase family protein